MSSERGAKGKGRNKDKDKHVNDGKGKESNDPILDRLVVGMKVNRILFLLKVWK